MKINIEQQVDGNGKHWWIVTKGENSFWRNTRKEFWAKWVTNEFYFDKDYDICKYKKNHENWNKHEDLSVKYLTFEEAKDKATEIIKERLAGQIQTVSSVLLDETTIF